MGDGIKMFSDSKFRRETSNFKIDFTAEVDEREEPGETLIKTLPLGMKPEEFLGMVFFIKQPSGGIVYLPDECIQITNVLVFDNYYGLTNGDDSFAFYNPENGALSAFGPIGIVPEEHDAIEPGVIIPPGELEYET